MRRANDLGPTRSQYSDALADLDYLTLVGLESTRVVDRDAVTDVKDTRVVGLNVFLFVVVLAVCECCKMRSEVVLS